MAAQEPDDGSPIVGATGARFGGASRRRRRARSAAAIPAPAADPGADHGTDHGIDHDDPDAPTVPVPTVHDHEPADVDADLPWLGGPAANPALAVDEATDSGVGVRPYVLTGGRTRATLELAIETLVSLRPGADPAAAASPAHRAVLDCCTAALSVAEIAATTRVPLGVARVLIGDLAAANLLTVHGTAATMPDQDLMSRVLDGLRRL